MNKILSMSLVLCMILCCACSRNNANSSETETVPQVTAEIPRSEDVLRELTKITFSFSPEKIHFGHVSELVATLHNAGHKEEARKTLVRGIEALKKVPNDRFKVQLITQLLFRAWKIGEDELASQILEEIETLAQVVPGVMHDVREICYATDHRGQAEAILMEFFRKFDSLDEKGQGNFLSDILANEFGDTNRSWALSHEYDELAKLPSKAVADQHITNDIRDTSDGVYSEEKMAEFRRTIAPYMERALNLSDADPGKPEVLEQLTKICLERNLLEEALLSYDLRMKMPATDQWKEGEEEIFQTILWKLTFCAESERFADCLLMFQKRLLSMKNDEDIGRRGVIIGEPSPFEILKGRREANYLAYLLRYMVRLGQVEEAKQFAGHFDASWAEMFVQHEAAIRLARQGEYGTALKMVESPQQQWPTRREYTLGQLAMIYAKNDQPDWVRKTLEIMDPEILTYDGMGHAHGHYTEQHLTKLVLFYLTKGDFKNVENVLAAAPKQKNLQGSNMGAGMLYSSHLAFDVPSQILSSSDSYNTLTDDAKRRLLHWLLRLTIAEPADTDPARKMAWCAIVIDLFKKHGETIPDGDINDYKRKAESEAKSRDIIKEFGDPNDLKTLDLPTALKRRDEPFWGGNLFLHYIAQLSNAGRIDEAFEAAKHLRDDQRVPLELIVVASKHGRYDEAMTLALAQKMDAKQHAELISNCTSRLIADGQFANALKSARTIHNQNERFNEYMYLIRSLIEQESKTIP